MGRARGEGVVGSFGAERTVGGGWAFVEFDLRVHLRAGDARWGGQGGRMLWGLLEPRGLWEGGRHLLNSSVSALEGWGCDVAHLSLRSARNTMGTRGTPE